MSKAERLIEMMITINAKKDFTVGELAKEFSVSKRTILRDLQELEQAGFPLYSEVGAAGGYHILKERILPLITIQQQYNIHQHILKVYAQLYRLDYIL